ncbi:GGDEF domain-containing protein [Lysinibacillus sp. 54212]|uniref:GGDEF domain-containing protein n=1 Tax=Lysinibacillus sp. 54212 TaxID=3119829 RepID=UPI002FCA69A5
MENIFTINERQKYHEQAIKKLQNGDYLEAENLFQLLSESFLQEEDFENYIKVNLGILKILVMVHRFEEMYDYLVAIEPYIKNYAKKREKLAYSITKALFHYLMGIRSPIQDFEKIYDEAVATQDYHHVLRAAVNLLHIYNEEGQIAKGYTLIENVTPYLDLIENDDRIMLLTFFINSCDIYYANKDFENIENILAQLEENALHSSIIVEEYNYWSIKGLYILQQGNLDQAKQYFDKAYSMVHDKFYFVPDLERWVQAMKDIGEIEQAYNYQCLLVDALKGYIALEKKMRRTEIISKLSTSGVIERLHHDRLSGAKSRAYFEEEIEKHRELLHYSVAVFDIDKFKVVNDAFGHLVGDQAIKFIASKALEWLPKRDMKLIRYGGDEFIIFMPYPKEEIELDMIRLREKIAKSEFIIRETGDTIHFNVSIGVSYTDHTPATLMKLFEAADQALYYAKQNGRNQVIFREVCH